MRNFEGRVLLVFGRQIGGSERRRALASRFNMQLVAGYGETRNKDSR